MNIDHSNYYFVETLVTNYCNCANPDCPYHKGQGFPVTMSQHIYRLPHIRKPFCSYNCRCDYIRKHGVYTPVLMRNEH